MQPINNLQETYRSLMNSNNPIQFLQNLAKNNPQLSQVMNMVNMSGRTPRDLFYQMARQKGVNPEEILRMFR